MNPGVQANMIAIVLLILVFFGWGARTLQDGHLTPRRASLLLLSYVLLVGYPLAVPGGLHCDLGGVLLPLALTAWMMLHCSSWSLRLQWVMGILTVASVLVVLMTLLPLDPAFFPLDAAWLYPLAAAGVAVFSVRRPFAALTIAVVGMALAQTAVLLLHGQAELRSVVLEGGEMRDMIAYAAAFVLVAHRPYHLCVRYLLGILKHLFGRQEEGPEHV